jgi:Na+-driven multidrug efflux pump
MWAVCVPLAFCLSRFTDMSILPLYCLCQSTELLKCLLGGFVLKQGKWIQNLTV